MPRPNMVCPTKLLMRATVGLGVFAPAIPAPMPGIIIKKGATMPNHATSKAGSMVGKSSHWVLTHSINIKPYTMPIR